MKDRHLFIGGSDAAAVVGASRWATPLKVWAEKTGITEPDDISEVLAVELGNELENFVAQKFSKITGKKVHRVNETIVHPRYDYIRANIDRRVVGEDSILECKTASAWKEKEWEGEEIPTEYIIQCMHYLMVTGKKVCYLAVLIGNHKFLWKEILRDEQQIAILQNKEVEFWNDYVLPGVMPDVVSCNDSDILQDIFKVTTPDIIELDNEADLLIDLIKSIQEDEKSIKAKIEQKKNELKVMLGAHEIGTTERNKVTWMPVTTVRIDSKRIKEELPELYAQYSNASTSRQLRITAKKEK